MTINDQKLTSNKYSLQDVCVVEKVEELTSQQKTEFELSNEVATNSKNILKVKHALEFDSADSKKVKDRQLYLNGNSN